MKHTNSIIFSTLVSAFIVSSPFSISWAQENLYDNTPLEQAEPSIDEQFDAIDTVDEYSVSESDDMSTYEGSEGTDHGEEEYDPVLDDDNTWSEEEANGVSEDENAPIDLRDNDASENFFDSPASESTSDTHSNDAPEEDGFAFDLMDEKTDEQVLSDALEESNEKDEKLEAYVQSIKEEDFTNSAKVRALNKITARTHILTLKKGETLKFGNLYITLNRCWKAPETQIPESKALLFIQDRVPGEDVKTVFEGWMFASSPSLSALEHPVYDVRVLECVNAASNELPTAPESKVE